MNALLSEFLEYAVGLSIPPRIRRVAYTLIDVLREFVFHNSQTVTVNSTGQISFVPRGSMNVRTTSLTRFIRYLSQTYDVFSGIDIQPIQDEIVKWSAMELGSDQWTFKEVTGADLIAAYATGPHSCMRGRNAQLALYSTNPEKVALLQIFQHGRYEGRALLWTLDNGRRFLDRIYPGNGTLAFAARRYARMNGWIYRDYDGVGSGLNDNYIEMKVTLKHVTNRRIPYLDTMRFIHRCDDGGLTLSAHSYNKDRSVYYPVVGNYTGYCNLIYSNIRYLDGSPVVNRLKVSYRRAYFDRNPYTSTQIMVRGRRIEVALKPTDVIYRIKGEFVTHSVTTLIEIEGRLYRRQDVRKRRNIDEYIPKQDAKPYVIYNTITLENGATLLEVEA